MPVTVDCQCCGHALALPPDLREGASFACAHCGLVLRNLAPARSFRWTHFDPYVRRHGASRANLWGGLLGALAWLPTLAFVLWRQDRFDVLTLTVLAVPYLLLLVWLRARRARTPAVVFMMELWAGLGLYLLFLALLGWAWPSRFGDVFAAGGLPREPVAALGVLWLVLGAVGRGWYRWRAARLPQLSGTAPVDAQVEA